MTDSYRMPSKVEEELLVPRIQSFKASTGRNTVSGLDRDTVEHLFNANLQRMQSKSLYKSSSVGNIINEVKKHDHVASKLEHGKDIQRMILTNNEEQLQHAYMILYHEKMRF